MKLARHDLVAALELRYDHYSSKSLFEAACKRAGLDDQDQYSAAEVAQFRAALSKLGDRLQRVDDRLDSLLGAAEPKPANVPQDPTPMPAKPDEPAPPRDEPKPANVPQDPTPMPTVTETSSARPPSNPAQAPQSTAAPDAARSASKQSSATPDASKPAQAPQAAAAMPAPKSVPSTEAGVTRIVLTGIELADGETLFVCGDRAELGNWDPERARPMMREGDAWSAVVTPGEGSFKFLRRTEDGVVVWEGGENRELGTALQIETSWQP